MRRQGQQKKLLFPKVRCSTHIWSTRLKRELWGEEATVVSIPKATKFIVDPRLMVVVGLVWLTQDCSEHTDTDMLTRWRQCRYFYLFLCKSIRLPDPDPPWRGLGHSHGGEGTGGHWWLCGGARRVVFTLYTLHTVCLCKPFCVHY